MRSLETTARGEKEPEFIPNESTDINLEHVMPNALENGWYEFVSQTDIDSHHSRIGNMVLLQAAKNAKLGSANFNKKSSIYKNSSFLLTSQVGELPRWDIALIEKRQKTLAELAVQTWPL